MRGLRPVEVVALGIRALLLARESRAETARGV
jgi:hypothetical protein